MTTVWVLMKGEDHEGGDILGVYATRDLALRAFAAAASALPSALDDAQHHDDGAVRVHAGCDWLELAPHEVLTRPKLPGGAP